MNLTDPQWSALHPADRGWLAQYNNWLHGLDTEPKTTNGLGVHAEAHRIARIARSSR